VRILTNSAIGYNGRLGNQLFQFASVFGIASRTGRTPIFPEENTKPALEYAFDGRERMVKFELPSIFPKIKTTKYKSEKQHK
jgi:hypothetical protein